MNMPNSSSNSKAKTKALIEAAVKMLADKHGKVTPETVVQRQNSRKGPGSTPGGRDCGGSSCRKRVAHINRRLLVFCCTITMTG